MAVHGVKQVVVVPTVFTATSVIEILKFGTEEAKTVAVDVLLSILLILFNFCKISLTYLINGSQRYR